MGSLVDSVLGFLGAKEQAQATEAAAGMSAEVMREQLALQQRMYEENVARQQPWLQAGQTALNALVPLATRYKPFNMRQFEADPGYAFRMAEGMKALERSAAARGGLLSGGTLKATQRFGQDLASQEYQNAFNRYQTERNAQLNPLQSLAGVGQTTAQQLGTAGQTYAGTANQLALANLANQGNLGLAASNIRATQYGQFGNALNAALNTNWGQVGNYFGNPATAMQYGTSPGSQQTSMLAAQEAGMWP